MGEAVPLHQPRHAAPVGMVRRAVIGDQRGAAHQRAAQDERAGDPAAANAVSGGWEEGISPYAHGRV